MKRLPIITCVVFCCSPLFAVSAEPQTPDETVQGFLSTYCLRCHNAERHEGEFRLDSLSRDFADMFVAQRWGEVLFRMNSGEMPPRDEPQPGAEELGAAADWIAGRMDEGRAQRMAKRGPVSHYRLSRDEYACVIYDLLGVHFDVRMPGALNEDPRWHGFDRIGSMLTLSPSHVTRYLAAADTVLQQAFPAQVPASELQRQAAEAPERWLLLPGWQQGNLNIRHAGLYRIRVQLSGLPSFTGRLPRLSIWNNSLRRAEVGRDVMAAELEPTVIEIETFLPQGTFRLTSEAPGKLDDGHTLGSTPQQVTRLDELQLLPKGYKLFTDEPQRRPIFPLLLVDWVEYEGPILPASDQQKREAMYPAVENDLTAARASLQHFIRRAWRRPPGDQEIERYLSLLQSELQTGADFRSAYLSTMAGIMASGNFYYIVEGSAEQPRAQINDLELASRLSFFLWSSLPDAELTELAERGELHQPDVLREQLRRMLADQRVNRFLDTFPKQWLQLHRVGMFPPDPELYPDYDAWLEQSMIRETTEFFAEVFRKNLSIGEFLDSDWTVLNSRLAMHYGIEMPTTTEFRRFTPDLQHHRGGILTQASVLSLTSDGTRQRPVHRGVWISEAIFGRTPPPPPPNVDPLEPTPGDQPKASIRQQLEAHSTHAICASCHQKIDPLGFAFENYDAIGRWRTVEKSSGGTGADPPVVAVGTFPDGDSFATPEEFRKLLAGDPGRFAAAFVEHLATFALRRVMTVDDREQIEAIAAVAAEKEYRLQALIQALVMSNLFQQR